MCDNRAATDQICTKTQCIVVFPCLVIEIKFVKTRERTLNVSAEEGGVRPGGRVVALGLPSLLLCSMAELSSVANLPRPLPRPEFFLLGSLLASSFLTSPLLLASPPFLVSPLDCPVDLGWLRSLEPPDGDPSGLPVSTKPYQWDE